MATSKIQNAAKIAHRLHENVFLDDAQKKLVSDKIKKMIFIYDSAQLGLSSQEKETLYCATYLHYALNSKYIQEGQKTLSIKDIQSQFGADTASLCRAFSFLHTPKDLSVDAMWINIASSFKAVKREGDLLPENKLAQLLIMADLASDLMSEKPVFYSDSCAARCEETLGKMIVANKLRPISPLMADSIEKEGVRLLAAYVPLWQKKLNEQGQDVNVFAKMIQASFAEEVPTDASGRDVGQRARLQKFVETPSIEDYNFNLNAKDDYLGDRTRIILKASQLANTPIPPSYASDTLYYLMTVFADQGKAYTTAATQMGLALVNYIAQNATKDDLPDLLLKQMPELEGLENLAQSVNSNTYIFDTAALKKYNGTARSTQDCYDLKEAVLMSYNPFIVNYARQKLTGKSTVGAVVNSKHTDTEDLLLGVLSRRVKHKMRS